jgi:hypothetical protein
VAKLYPHIPLRTLQHRYKLYKKEKQQIQQPITNETILQSTIDHRSINKQKFTPQQETILSNHIKNIIDTSTQLITKSIIKEQAHLYYKQINPHSTTK